MPASQCVDKLHELWTEAEDAIDRGDVAKARECRLEAIRWAYRYENDFNG